jgi:formate-dependent nitrite reductase membrane component NrfD
VQAERAPLNPVDWHPSFTPSRDVIKRSQPLDASDQGYGNVPILKRPLWGWEIAWYFFLEGISASASILCTLADMTGGESYHRTTRPGRALALATMMPCPWLLTHDLGRPARFHHMFRVLKLKSPMNLGTWALTGYGAFVTLHAALEAPVEKLPFRIPGLSWLQRVFPARLWEILNFPFQLTMISYPGVLLGNTSIPVWSHSKLTGTLLGMSSLNAGTAALSLVAETAGDERSALALRRIENAVSAAEIAALTGYVASAPKASKPLVKGSQSKLFWIGAIAVGIVLPAVLRRRESRTANVLASMLTLGGTFALKWALVHSGKESAMDRDLAIHNADSARNGKATTIEAIPEIRTAA